MRSLLFFSFLILLSRAQDRTRIDCYPESSIVFQDQCEARGCVWTPFVENDPFNIPFCYQKASQLGYTATKQTDGSYTLIKFAGPASPWGDDIPRLKFSYKDIGKGGLIFTDKFIQITTLLPSEHMYGWGENVHPNLKHDFSRYTAWGMFARDQAPSSQGLDTKNLYGVHPFFMIVEPDGKAHGVFFLNTNAQDVTTIPAPGLIYRTIGGILDIYFFPAPSPAQVIQQYHAFIGRPFLPAYWSLGYQLCRWGYKSLEDMKTRVDAVRQYKIPFDVAYADIDYMNRFKDFTTGDNWAGFGDYVRQMHEWGMHNILIFDPAVQVDYDTFQRGRDMGASFIEWERDDEVQRDINDKYPLTKGTKTMLGVVWPDKHIAFPDFLDTTNKTDDWWTGEFNRYWQEVPFDGAWIDMNEPSVFGTNDKDPFPQGDQHYGDGQLKCPTSGADAEWDMPPYKTQAMERVRSTQKSVHAATGKRGVVISRSTYPSTGRYSGHWLGDNKATWQDIRSAVIGAIEMNMFGIPYVGSDVCGFNGESNEELCLRWQQLGSFHSFFRIHNAEGHQYQDPAVWPSVAAATKKANEFRYSMLPYLYSLHFRASLYGDTVVRPLFFEFPTDTETLEISEQFMWGPSIIVAPVLYKGATTVTAYIPAATFYSLYDQNYGQKVSVGISIFSAPMTSNIPSFLRAGSIIPRQPANLTTVTTRLGNFNLLIASPDSGSTASGELFWDDGDSIVDDVSKSAYTHSSFTYSTAGKSVTLKINTNRAQAPSVPSLAYLEIFAFPAAPDYTSFKLNGQTISIDTLSSKFSPFTKILTVYFSKPISFAAQGEQTIMWNFV